MAEPDLIRLLSMTRWEDVPACLIRHQHEAARIDPAVLHRLLASTDGPARPGRPGQLDVGILLVLVASGGIDLATHHVDFVRAASAVADAPSDEDREDLITEALIAGLIVTDALRRPLLVDRLVELAEVGEALPHASTQLMALVATTRSTAFDLTGDVSHADASIDAFRTVVAPPDGGGLTGARSALALVLAARDRATAAPGSGHDDLLEAIAIARASASLDPPLDAEGELAVNTLLTLLAELFQATGDLAAVDEALGVVDRLADRPPTVGQLAARVLWLRLRYERSQYPGDLTRALLAVDEALTRAVTDSAATYDAADVEWLREARRHILLALSGLRKRPGEPEA